MGTCDVLPVITGNLNIHLHVQGLNQMKIIVIITFNGWYYDSLSKFLLRGVLNFPGVF